MISTKLRVATRFNLSVMFCVILVACASGVEPATIQTLSPTLNDVTEVEPTSTAVPAKTSTPTPKPVENQIAFFVAKGVDASIYRMNPDGSGLSRLVNLKIGLGENSTTYQSDISLANVNTDTFSWSPDGAWIVYASSEDGDSDLYAIDVEGTTKIKLTDTPDDEWLPSWSPDGRYIAYAVKTPDTAYILDLETMETKQIFEIMELSQGWLDQFTWSPDSNILTYTALSGNGYVIWDIFGHIASNDFKSIGRFVPHPGRTIGALNWSPSGDSFVYSGEVKAFGDIGLFITESGSRSEQRLLTVSPKGQNQSKLFNTDWSPDGTTLVYSITDESRTSDIYRIDPDGKNLTRLTENTYSPCECTGYLSPTWSPDGSKIVYLSIDGVKQDIFIMNPDGSEQINLTNDSDNSDLKRWNPQWQPIRKSMNIPLSKTDGETIRELTEIGASIPGRSIDAIVLNLEKNDFECHKDDSGSYWVICERSVDTLRYRVEIISQSPDQFDQIDASISDPFGNTVTEDTLSNFLGYAVTLPFLEQPEIQELAKEELVNFLVNNGVEWTLNTSYGDVDLTIRLYEQRLHLFMNRLGSNGFPNPVPVLTNTPPPILPTPTEIVVGKAIQDIMKNLEENNYKCRLWFDESAEIYTATCSRSEGTLNYSVEISFTSMDRYDRIEAYVIDMAEPPGEYSHQEFFVRISMLPFLDQPNLQGELKDELGEYDLTVGSEYIIQGFIIKAAPFKRGLNIYIEPSEK